MYTVKMYIVTSLLLLLLWLPDGSLGQHHPHQLMSYDEHFLLGVELYQREKWKNSIPYFNLSEGEWGGVESSRGSCYSGCVRRFPGESDYYQWLFSTAHCSSSCLPPNPLSHSLHEKLISREVLYYLQMALHKVGRHSEAARTCAQYLYAHPGDGRIEKQMRKLRRQNGVTNNDIQPQYTDKYRELHVEGHRLYYAEEWSEMVETFESSLLLLYRALADCRNSCHGPTQLHLPINLPQTMTYLHAGVLACQAGCSEKLGSFRSDKSDRFFASFFHYLQYGYYFLNRSKDAVEASASRVRLDPTNEDAQKSAVFYKQRPGVTSKDFKPREDVLIEILKEEAVTKYAKLLYKVYGEYSEQDEDDQLLLEKDFKEFPLETWSNTDKPSVFQ